MNKFTLVKYATHHIYQPESSGHNSMFWYVVGIAHVNAGRWVMQRVQVLHYICETGVVHIYKYHLTTAKKRITFKVQLHTSDVPSFLIDRIALEILSCGCFYPIFLVRVECE